jgi:hypothetical protein
VSTVLDLIGEFGTLNDTKLRASGALPPEDEARWTELKRFYELLMSREGLPAAGDMPRFTAEDIRACLSDRERIRVPVEAPIVFEHEGRHHTGRQSQQVRCLHRVRKSSPHRLDPHALLSQHR